MYSNAQYMNKPYTNEPDVIRVNINGVTCWVPIDPANTDYQNIMQLVEKGELVIAPADETPAL